MASRLQPKPAAAGLLDLFIYLFSNTICKLSAPEIHCNFWIDWAPNLSSAAWRKNELVTFQSEIQGVQPPPQGGSEMTSRRGAMRGNAASLHKEPNSTFPAAAVFVDAGWSPCNSPQLSWPSAIHSSSLSLHSSSSDTFWPKFLLIARTHDVHTARLRFRLLVPPFFMFVQHCWLFSFQHPQQQPIVVHCNFTVCSLHVCVCARRCLRD